MKEKCARRGSGRKIKVFGNTMHSWSCHCLASFWSYQNRVEQIGRLAQKHSHYNLHSDFTSLHSKFLGTIISRICGA